MIRFLIDESEENLEKDNWFFKEYFASRKPCIDGNQEQQKQITRNPDSLGLFFKEKSTHVNS